jgi:hypothetical protein
MCWKCKKRKAFDLLHFDKIRQDIRNVITLNKIQLEYINELPHQYQFEIILLYNECITQLRQTIEEIN